MEVASDFADPGVTEKEPASCIPQSHDKVWLSFSKSFIEGSEVMKVFRAQVIADFNCWEGGVVFWEVFAWGAPSWEFVLRGTGHKDVVEPKASLKKLLVVKADIFQAPFRRFEELRLDSHAPKFSSADSHEGLTVEFFFLTQGLPDHHYLRRRRPPRLRGGLRA